MHAQIGNRGQILSKKKRENTTHVRSNLNEVGYRNISNEPITTPNLADRRFDFLSEKYKWKRMKNTVD